MGSQEGVPLEGMAQVEARGAQTHGHEGSEKDRMDLSSSSRGGGCSGEGSRLRVTAQAGGGGEVCVWGTQG